MPIEKIFCLPSPIVASLVSFTNQTTYESNLLSPCCTRFGISLHT